MASGLQATAVVRNTNAAVNLHLLSRSQHIAPDPVSQVIAGSSDQRRLACVNSMQVFQHWTGDPAGLMLWVAGPLGSTADLRPGTDRPKQSAVRVFLVICRWLLRRSSSLTVPSMTMILAQS